MLYITAADLAGLRRTTSSIYGWIAAALVDKDDHAAWLAELLDQLYEPYADALRAKLP